MAENALDLKDLPEDVREAIAPHAQESSDMLLKISRVIADKRDEAKAARAASGIEFAWQLAEEAYAGVDDANRHEMGHIKWSKGLTPDAPLNTNDERRRGDDKKSTIFFPLTARYVDAAVAKLQEIIIPIDDKSFSIEATPVPDLIAAKDDKRQIRMDELPGAPVAMRDARPDEIAALQNGQASLPPGLSPLGGLPAPAAAPGGGAVLPPGAAAPPGLNGADPSALLNGTALTPPETPKVPLTPADMAEEKLKEADAIAKRADRKIWDWQIEGKYTNESRKVIADSARLGAGVLKGPIPLRKKAKVMRKAEDGFELMMEEKIIPGSKWVDLWNFYPDPSCGENVHDGDFSFERDYLSEHQVRELRGMPGYIDFQLARAIDKGPTSNSDGSERKPGQSATSLNGRYETWYFYGALKREEMECLCATAGNPDYLKDKVPDKQREIYAIVTMIGDIVVRAVLNPLTKSGALPYDVMPWRRRAGHWAGVGIPEQMQAAQRLVNNSLRAMANNLGLSGGVQIVLDEASIEPADGERTITPNKMWLRTAEGAAGNIQQQFAVFQIPNVTPHMMSVIELGMRMAEESTSIPLVTQGQSGETTPETFGATQLQNNNANQLLRSLGYIYDDTITEPQVHKYYEWYLLDPDVPGEDKGEFTIKANGSTALVERAIQDQTIAQILQPSLDPRYELDPALTMRTYLKSKKLSPQEMALSEEKKKAAAAQPQQAMPAIEAAKIRAATEEKKIATTSQIATAKLDILKDDVESDKIVALQELAVRERLAMLDYANRHQMTIEQVKGQLAGKAMTLETQERMAGANRAEQSTQRREDRNAQGNGKRPKPIRRQRGGPSQVAPQGAEPLGRAPAGEAFIR